MNKLLPGLISFIIFLPPLFALSQENLDEQKRMGFGIGVISSIGEEDDWGINSQFFWRISSRGTIEFEFNQYYDKMDFRRMDEYGLNYQFEVYKHRRLILYVAFGYIANNYDWDKDECRNCWAIRKGRWNHGLNGGIGLSIQASSRTDIYQEIRPKSMGRAYQIGVLGLNYFMVEPS